MKICHTLGTNTSEKKLKNTMIVLCRIKMASLVLLGGLKVYLHIPDLRTVDGETNYFQ